MADVGTTRPRRKAIPDRAKLFAALRRLGLRIDQVNFDHDPPLALRPIDPETGDTIPPANDPDHIYLVTIDEHRAKTFGRGGARRITTADGDIHKIAKAKSLAKAEEAFRARLLAKEPGEPRPKRSSIPSRKFASARRGKEHDAH